MTTGEIIKKLRKEHHMTQEQLGEYIGVQKSAIAKWENGKTKNLKRDTIHSLAVLFGVRPAYIRGEIEETLMLNAEETKLVKAYRVATDQQKKIVAVTLGVD